LRDVLLDWQIRIGGIESKGSNKVEEMLLGKFWKREFGYLKGWKELKSLKRLERN
jgi:hypothetical protein